MLSRIIWCGSCLLLYVLLFYSYRLFIYSKLMFTLIFSDVFDFVGCQPSCAATSRVFIYADTHQGNIDSTMRWSWEIKEWQGTGSWLWWKVFDYACPSYSIWLICVYNIIVNILEDSNHVNCEHHITQRNNLTASNVVSNRRRLICVRQIFNYLVHIYVFYYLVDYSNAWVFS
jgi:hypothetical protein